MSQHPSFGGGSATERHRSVLKRYEKLEMLNNRGQWTEDDGILGIKKVKVLKIKAKKSSGKKTEEKSEGKDAKASK